ncbi:MAG: metallophosphoesterase [Flavobacteriales bacterium]|nr:metallophosphoesterase [Flavobacteriales bacterium]
MRTFVFGDIHGCFDEFVTLYNQIGIMEEDQIISLGDIVDRGNKSLEVFNFFRSRSNAMVLMGNHERKHMNGTLSYSQEIVKVQMGDHYDDFCKYCHSLPYYYEHESAIIIHAYYEHDKELHQQKEEVLSGSTSGVRYLDRKYGKGEDWILNYNLSKPLIYGHSVVGNHVKIENNTYGIDTGACHAGYLTAIELPGFKIHQVKVQHDYWRQQQDEWQLPILANKDWENLRLDNILKQLNKLAYKEDIRVKSYLEALRIWLEALKSTQITVLTKMLEKADKLRNQYGVEFNQKARLLDHASLLFKARDGRLLIEDIEKRFDTPLKIEEICKEFSLSYPNRELVAFKE